MFLIPNVSQKLSMVESKAVQTGKRGPCKNRGNAAEAKEVLKFLEHGEEEDVSEILDNFLVVSKDGVLPIEMAKICNLLRWRTTPESFCEQIDDGLGNASKLRAKHRK
jgi:hypothetical protein